MGLSMKPACEQCNVALGHRSKAFICSHECTFCPDCAAAMNYRCRNCSGELVRRPIRVPASAPATDPG